MKAWQVHKLVETDKPGKPVIGGSIVGLKVTSELANPNEISVQPTSKKEQEQTGASLKLQVAHKVVWLGAEESAQFIELHNAAHSAAFE